GVNFSFALVRYNSDGIIDSTFGISGIVKTIVGGVNDELTSLSIQSDGKIIGAGYAKIGSYYKFALVRYQLNGSLDSTFGINGIVTSSAFAYDDYATSAAIQSDGKIVVAGFSFKPFESYFSVLRLQQDGTLDSSFGLNGWSTAKIDGGTNQLNAIAV